MVASVGVCAHEVQGHVRVISDDPAIVPRGDVEKVSGLQVDHAAIVHGRHGTTGYDEPYVLDHATFLTRNFAHVFRPLPAWIVGGPADRHLADFDQFEPALLKIAHCIWFVEALQDDFVHKASKAWLFRGTSGVL
jgi:hypothetical protein